MIRTLAYFKCSVVIPSSPGALRTLSETSVSLYLPLLYYNIEFCPMPCNVGLTIGNILLKRSIKVLILKKR